MYIKICEHVGVTQNVEAPRQMNNRERDRQTERETDRERERQTQTETGVGGGVTGTCNNNRNNFQIFRTNMFVHVLPCFL